MKRICMKRLRTCSLLLLAVLLLTLTVFADSGPKPMIYVRVENGPEEPYYMDLLEEDPYTPYSFGPDQSVWGYSKEDAAALDRTLMDALLAAVPEGWHACSLQGTRQGVPIFGDLDGRNAPCQQSSRPPILGVSAGGSGMDWLSIKRKGYR